MFGNQFLTLKLDMESPSTAGTVSKELSQEFSPLDSPILIDIWISILAVL